MQAELLYIDDAMPLNDTDKGWIRNEIREALSKRGLGGFIKDWLPPAAAIAILIFIGTQYTAYIEFRTKTDDRLQNLEKNVQTLLAAQTKSTLTSLAALPARELKNTLLDVKSSVVSARKQNVKLPTKLMDDLAQRLNDIETSAPDYWPAAIELVSYIEPLPFSVTNDTRDFGQCKSFLPLLTRFSRTPEAP